VSTSSTHSGQARHAPLYLDRDAGVPPIPVTSGRGGCAPYRLRGVARGGRSHVPL
jgi:hypothetical protein